MIKIRNAEQEDIATLVELSYVMFKESQFAQYQFNPMKMEALWANMINAPTVGICLVAEVDGEVVGGFLGAVTEHFFGDCTYAADMGLFVHPDHRKGKVGILLLQGYLAAAKALDADEIVIGNSTGLEFERIAALFESVGFRKYGYVFRMKVEK